MKKLLLFSLFAITALLWSCLREPVIDHTPPEGIWEELVWVPIIENGVTRFERKTFDEMTDGQRDTLVYIASRFEFVPNSDGNGGTMFVEVRYGDGPPKPGSDSLHCFPGNPQRRDFFVAQYTLHEERNSHRQIIKYLIANNSVFTGPDFGISPPNPLPCSSVGTFSRTYDYAYQNVEKTRLRLGFSHQDRWGIHFFVKQ